MRKAVFRKTTLPQALQDIDIGGQLNTQGLPGIWRYFSDWCGEVQPPRGKLTLKVARRGPPCPWGPRFASEEELNGHPRVNILARI